MENLTKPTIETVLERMESLRTGMLEQMASLRTEMSDKIESLRTEMRDGFHRLEMEGAANNRALQRQFDHLAGELGRMKVAQDYIEEHLKKAG